MSDGRQSRRTILSVAYPFAKLGPDAVGGAEQVLTTLESALVARGLQSVVAADAMSQVSGTLVGVEVPAGLLTDEKRVKVEERLQDSIDAAVRRRSIDVVHMHGIDFYRYRLPRNVPVLVTLHLPLNWYPSEIWTLPPNIHLQCVSKSQRATCAADHRERLTVIENGVPIPAPTADRKGRFALLLSRICPEKNLHMALDAARMAGVSVILAGQVFPYPEHVRYFEQQIVPRLGRGARFVGPVGGKAKQRLLARARCLLLPTLAEETSSLVAMEALASGTPVVALPSGAIPEIVEEGRTGFLVRDMQEMAARLKNLNEIDPAACRSVAMERFSAQAMVERYVSHYASLLR